MNHLEHPLSAKPKLCQDVSLSAPSQRIPLQQQLRQFQGDLGLRVPHALPEEKEAAELDHIVHGLGSVGELKGDVR